MKTAATKKRPCTLSPLHLPAGQRRMRAQLGKIGRIRTEVVGAPCPHCGASKYQVVLHRDLPVGSSNLVSRCTRCRTQRDLEMDGMKDAVLFRYGLHAATAPIPGPGSPA